MDTLPWLYLIVPWAAFAFCWRRGWFEAARIAAALGTLVLSLVAAYHWQAYGRAWALGIPFVIGMAVVTAAGKAKGEGVGALGKAALAVALPILLMLMTFNYFQKLFLTIRADGSVREFARIPGRVSELPPERREEAVRALVAALERDDLFVRWGAVHQLWMSGPAAAPAAEPVARALVASRDGTPSAERLYFRRDGAHFLGSLGADGVPALLFLLRGGDEELQGDALYELERMGPPLKEAVLPGLAQSSPGLPPGLSYRLESARKALGVTDEEWREALAALPPR
ncbi:MAG: hypothetical protein WC969_01130 [Elusimicrobiota bacterium]|jgi:hypothetical protein